MAVEDFPLPMSLMNFVSEDQLAELNNTRGARVEDGTTQRDRPLYEWDFKRKYRVESKVKLLGSAEPVVKVVSLHLSSSGSCVLLSGPPKALDEDETEFLEKLDMDPQAQLDLDKSVMAGVWISSASYVVALYDTCHLV
ncbi:hypothetical protein RND71_001662 [Anisodus tanguticus]|uniref:Uncharacterized protein n=1 Tax=Anisodus tanguticus TaxID=243964 RepID=A0AAE1T0N2_9SOLA|nr:hypothetical protein RND71_001662 [Anisodus tanguticus]